MNILFYISDITLGGGTESAAITLANELSKEVHNKIFIFAPFGFKEKSYFNIANNIKVIRLNIISRPLFNMIYINRKLSNILKTENIDYLISNEVMSIFFTLPAVKLSFKKIKFVTWDHFNYNVTLGKKGRIFARKIAAAFSPYIVTLTDEDSRLWVENLKPKGKIVSIANPSPFSNTDYIYSVNSKIIISIGRLTYVKGFDILLQIWKELKENYDIDGWKQYIIGDGEDKIALEQKTKILGLEDYIIFKPSTTDIKTYYLEASFIVVSSRTEGLPMTLIEAQQFGLPAISFYNNEVMYGPAQIISDKSGFVIEQFDVKEFACKMFALMSNDYLREKMAEASFTSSKRFNANTIKDSWIKEIIN